MTRKRKKPVPVGTISGLDVTRAHMPQHDGWVCRGGVHGDTAYNRRRDKAELKRLLKEEGGHGRPPFLWRGSRPLWLARPVLGGSSRLLAFCEGFSAAFGWCLSVARYGHRARALLRSCAGLRADLSPPLNRSGATPFFGSGYFLIPILNETYPDNATGYVSINLCT